MKEALAIYSHTHTYIYIHTYLQQAAFRAHKHAQEYLLIGEHGERGCCGDARQTWGAGACVWICMCIYVSLSFYFLLFFCLLTFIYAHIHTRTKIK